MILSWAKIASLRLGWENNTCSSLRHQRPRRLGIMWYLATAALIPRLSHAYPKMGLYVSWHNGLSNKGQCDVHVQYNFLSERCRSGQCRQLVRWSNYSSIKKPWGLWSAIWLPGTSPNRTVRGQSDPVTYTSSIIEAMQNTRNDIKIRRKENYIILMGNTITIQRRLGVHHPFMNAHPATDAPTPSLSVEWWHASRG